MATRLAPSVSPDTEFFWTGLRDHKLLIQRCTELSGAASAATPDVSGVQLARLGRCRVLWPRHRVQLRDATAPADAADGVPVHRRVGRTRRRCAVGVQPVRNRARRCRSRHARRGLLRDVRHGRREETSCCTSSARPDRRSTWTSRSPRNKRRSPRSRVSCSNTGPHPNISPRSRRVTCATTPRCGANWRPPTSLELLCPRTSAAAGTDSSSWRCFWPRSDGASRRFRSTPPSFSAPTPSPATATKASDSGTCPTS